MGHAIPEIVIGFVAPSGTDFDRVIELVGGRLAHYGYRNVPIRLSGILEEIAQDSGRLKKSAASDYAKRTTALQAEGDLLRQEMSMKHALALAAVSEIVNARSQANGGGEDSDKTPVEKLAYLVWSFKTPQEVETLRAIYRERFVAISVHTLKPKRLDRLAQRIAESRQRLGNPIGIDRADAEQIIENDEHEDRNGAGEFGQNVRDAYPLADYFVSADHPETVDRAIDIVFGHPFLTPFADEFGMFVANAAALRSAELGRQVGAAILNDSGEVLATGYNEVPAPLGGQYSADSNEDHREYTTGQDSSDEMRRLLAGSIEEKLREAVKGVDLPADAIQKALGGTHIKYLTEFGRALHAESSALMDAARRGVAVKGATIYVTTFPCHQCTRQVIASGCRRLVYIYPYPKSLAARFHGDAIFVDADGPATKVPFDPFKGVAPRRYVEAFAMEKRKDDDGKAVRGDDINRGPRLHASDPEGDWEAGSYVVREFNALKLVSDRFKRAVNAPAGTEESSSGKEV